jgi:hypothetical protein
MVVAGGRLFEMVVGSAAKREAKTGLIFFYKVVFLLKDCKTPQT